MTPAFGDQQWRQANQILEQRYLELGRAQIEEMCLDLTARLAARMSQGVQARLEAEQSLAISRSPLPSQLSSPSLEMAEMQRQIETAATMADKLLGDISWVLPWDQAKSLVEPYAKGSWLLAQIQAMEEQRVVAIFATELLEQATSYLRELIFRFYGAETPSSHDATTLTET